MDGSWATRCGHAYFVVGKQTEPYFVIAKHSSIVGNIAESLDDELVDELLREHDGELPREIQPPDVTPEELVRRQAAAVYWLDSIDDETMDAIIFHVKERISSPRVGFDLNPADEGSFLGIQLTRKVYPCLDEYSIRELDRSVQAVVSINVLAQNFIGETFDIDAAVLDDPSVPR